MNFQRCPWSCYPKADDGDVPIEERNGSDVTLQRAREAIYCEISVMRMIDVGRL
jgi:hypothetical protein